MTARYGAPASEETRSVELDALLAGDRRYGIVRGDHRADDDTVLGLEDMDRERVQ